MIPVETLDFATARLRWLYTAACDLDAVVRMLRDGNEDDARYYRETAGWWARQGGVPVGLYFPVHEPDWAAGEPPLRRAA